MSTLSEFPVTFEVDEDRIQHRPEDDNPRSLARYSLSGQKIFVQSRVFPQLLDVARDLPFVRLRIEPKSGKPDADGLLSVANSALNYSFTEDLAEAIEVQNFPACVIAELHGEGRRDWVWTVEDVTHFTSIVETLPSVENGYLWSDKLSIGVEQHELGSIGAQILPIEFAALAGMTDGRPAEASVGFRSGVENLRLLRPELEKHGMVVKSMDSIMGMICKATLPTNIEDFRDFLYPLISKGREYGCAYLAEETIDGPEVFRLTHPLPAQYTSKRGGAFAKFRKRFF